MSIVEKIYTKNTLRGEIKENLRTRDVISMKHSILSRKAEKSFIIEFKRKSPSGFKAPFTLDPVLFGNKVKEYADALSVLTEPDHFLGSLNDGTLLQNLNIPILMKDFVDREEMIESGFNAGFDAILLIADFIEERRLNELAEFARNLHLDVLIEFHDMNTLERIPDMSNVMYGYNRRNLKTLKMENDENMAIKKLTEKNVRVLESGINRENFKDLYNMPFEAYLIGTSVLQEPDFLYEIKKGVN
jgi:indole-3-glycerol phosphate synthase